MGIWLFNLAKILDDLKALIGDAFPFQDRFRTLLVIITATLLLLSTFRKAQDIREVVNNLKGRFLPNNCIFRALFYKMEKALDLSAVEKAALHAENNRLIEDACAVQPHIKKRVCKLANDKFAIL